MLNKEDLDSIHKLIAIPMQAAMEAQKELLNEKLEGLGRSVDTIRQDQTSQIKHCQKTTREMTDFKTGAEIKIQNLFEDSKKKDKRTWAIILAIVTLGLSELARRIFHL